MFLRLLYLTSSIKTKYSLYNNDTNATIAVTRVQMQYHPVSDINLSSDLQIPSLLRSARPPLAMVRPPLRMKTSPMTRKQPPYTWNWAGGERARPALLATIVVRMVWRPRATNVLNPNTKP